MLAVSPARDQAKKNVVLPKYAFSPANHAVLQF